MLKETLHQLIREAYPNVISLDMVHILAARMNHKQSYAERKLRPSQSPQVEAIFNQQGHITGYKWIPRFEQSQLI